MKLFLDTNIIIDLVSGREPFCKDDIYDIISSLLPMLTITTLGSSIIKRCLQKRGKDFEDDAQFFSALDAGADYIITRNKKDFPDDEIVLEPKEFFQKMNIVY